MMSDLSLAEIAGDTDITRQGVRDRIEKAKVQLMQLEDTLGLTEEVEGDRRQGYACDGDAGGSFAGRRTRISRPI